MTDTPWGPIGYITTKRTYMRKLKDTPDSPSEEFSDAVERVIKGVDKQLKCDFTTEEEGELRELLLSLKASVAGRFWWQLGTKTVEKLGLFSLQNCAFAVVNDPIEPFLWTFDALMLGSGVGFNIQKKYVYELPRPKRKIKIVREDTNDADFIVPDTREGWVELLKKTLEAHYITGKGFSYSTVLVRSKGAPIKGFGGTASGPEELCWGIGEINRILNNRAGKKVRPIDCLDMMNIIGAVVKAGNVRRSAQIAIGDCDDLQFLAAKNWSKGNIPNWRSNSNNSVVCNDFSLLPAEFWEGYNGEGSEPYGLINLRLARLCGRLGETEYPDPDVDGFNPCVTGDTLILTKSGHKPIDSLINQEVEIWNGFEWSEVTPKITGENQKILKVKFSDGRELKCTPYHKFHTQDGYGGSKTVTVKKAHELNLGDKLIKHSFPVVTDTDSVVLDKNLYTQGFYSADGNSANNFIWLYETKYGLEDRLDCTQIGKEYTNDVEVKRKYMKMNNPSLGKNWIPDEKYSVASRLQWLAGFLDGDGCVLKEGGIQAVSVDLPFLSDVQKLLSTLGVNSKVVPGRDAGERLLPDQKGSKKEYLCQKSERILIGSTQVQQLVELGLDCSRLDLDKSPNRDASRFTTITGIEEYGTEDFVYCFTEPKRNLGIFNGVITGQCAEQSLVDKETCCLAEFPLPLCESKEELFKIIRYLYKICKHSLRLKCHQEKTQEIVHKNMRMGIGVTGQCQATDEQLSWLADAYEYVRQLDKEYSAKMGWPESIKLTTVKPSGTISLMSGVTHGAHPGFSEYFIRRVRIDSQSPLVQVCKDHGFHTEFERRLDGTEDYSSVVASFPCSLPSHTKFAKDMSAVAQLENVKWLQTNWSDNSVSCSIYYQKEELDEIKEWMAENYNNCVKTCSFILHSDHGYDQPPYEEITKEEYDEMVKVTKTITSVEIKESDFDLEECEGGMCPIK